MGEALGQALYPKFLRPFPLHNVPLIFVPSFHSSLIKIKVNHLPNRSKTPTYVSPSDTIMSPCTAKLSAYKSKHFLKYALVFPHFLLFLFCPFASLSLPVFPCLLSFSHSTSVSHQPGKTKIANANPKTQPPRAKPQSLFSKIEAKTAKPVVEKGEEGI